MRSRVSIRGSVRPSVGPSVSRSVHRLVTHELKPCKSAVFDQNYNQHERGRLWLCRVYGLVFISFGFSFVITIFLPSFLFVFRPRLVLSKALVCSLSSAHPSVPFPTSFHSLVYPLSICPALHPAPTRELSIRPALHPVPTRELSIPPAVHPAPTRELSVPQRRRFVDFLLLRRRCFFGVFDPFRRRQNVGVEFRKQLQVLLQLVLEGARGVTGFFALLLQLIGRGEIYSCNYV